jgi:hypothetical protein
MLLLSSMELKELDLLALTPMELLVTPMELLVPLPMALLAMELLEATQAMALLETALLATVLLEETKSNAATITKRAPDMNSQSAQTLVPLLDQI